MNTIFDKTPDKIVDIDDQSEVLTMDIKAFAGSLDLKKLKRDTNKIRLTIQNNYDITFLATDIILYPYWECKIKGKKRRRHPECFY